MLSPAAQTVIGKTDWGFCLFHKLAAGQRLSPVACLKIYDQARQGANHFHALLDKRHRYFQSVTKWTGRFLYSMKTFSIKQEGSRGPKITSAVVEGKQLIVTGANFDNGALVFMDGVKMKKTGNSETSPTTA